MHVAQSSMVALGRSLNARTLAEASCGPAAFAMTATEWVLLGLHVQRRRGQRDAERNAMPGGGSGVTWMLEPTAQAAAEAAAAAAGNRTWRARWQHCGARFGKQRDEAACSSRRCCDTWYGVPGSAAIPVSGV